MSLLKTGTLIATTLWLAIETGVVGADAASWMAAFEAEPDDSLARRLVAPTSCEPIGELRLEQAIEPVHGQPSAVVRSTVQNPTDTPQPPVPITLAAWRFRGDGGHNAGYGLLEHRDDVWYESTYWQGGERWLRVGKDWHHPGDHAPSVRRFTAPQDGQVQVTGRVYKADPKGDGIVATILHNRKEVWRYELAGDDSQGVDPNVQLTVKAGDAVRFVVDKGNAIWSDTTHWAPVVAYCNGRTYRASDAFAEKRQGAGNWSYESPATDAPQAPGLARLLWFDSNWFLRTTTVAVDRPAILDDKTAQPLAILAAPDDQSGTVVAVDGFVPWQVEAVGMEDGGLSLRVVAKPEGNLAPGQTVSLPAVTLASYQGVALAGLRNVNTWLADAHSEEADKSVPCDRLRERSQELGVTELDYWAMIQADWQRQDGADQARPETFAAAFVTQLEKTKALLGHLQAAYGIEEEGRAFAAELGRIAEDKGSDPISRYLRLRVLKRRIALANPLMDFGQLLFTKRVPTSYSHLVMQYYGWRARPGGGLFILEEPGRSLRSRDILGGRLETGNVLEPRLSYDGKRIIFSYVECPKGPLSHSAVGNDQDPSENFYHIWEVNVDGINLRQLTNEAYDDLMPCYLPDGGIAFMSTRRKGYARCFGGQFSTRWDVYTLHRMEGDGSNIRTLSYHDTNEWYPAVSNTGHILYARWDYIDRDAVTHQNLWASRPDGTNPIAVWGNATSNPHCTFQAKPIPGSHKILFTASAHHSITAGSIAILDPNVARDGPAAIERITPEIPFPEAEGRDIREYYAAPWPLSEDFYLVAYSPYPLVWEPGANRKDALGIYLLDRFGNRELIYRNLEIGSTNPIPLRPRSTPPVLAGMMAEDAPPIGTMVVADVCEGLGAVPRDHIKALRIVQIFPKTTNVANRPPIGLAGEENARAVLGTVPVEPDGSAHFHVPAGKLLLFQALDKDGFAYQTMRSVTYVQPGEQTSCVGCHEPKMTAPVRPYEHLLALRRSPSEIDPGSWGGRPFNYVEVVQPVLDQHCVRCHGGEKTEGELVLTGEPAGSFTRSYVELMAAKGLVPRFAQRNQLQMTPPGGDMTALGSRLMTLLRSGHEDVSLSEEELRRLALWIDLNAIFYGVNLPEDQARMLRGELVEMPEIQ